MGRGVGHGRADFQSAFGMQVGSLRYFEPAQSRSEPAPLRIRLVAGWVARGAFFELLVAWWCHPTARRRDCAGARKMGSRWAVLVGCMAAFPRRSHPLNPHVSFCRQWSAARARLRGRAFVENRPWRGVRFGSLLERRVAAVEARGRGISFERGGGASVVAAGAVVARGDRAGRKTEALGAGGGESGLRHLHAPALSVVFPLHDPGDRVRACGTGADQAGEGCVDGRRHGAGRIDHGLLGYRDGACGGPGGGGGISRV